MRQTIAILFALGVTACGGGGSKTPAAPTPPPPANVSGDWTGNLESSNWTTVAVDANFTQANDSVNGTWAASSRDWNGIITGTTTPSTFSGTFTISAPNALGVGARCTGTASVSGGAGGATITWTSPGFTGTCTGMPINLRWNLQRR